MEVTLTKRKTFKLEPFGKFIINFLKCTKNISPKTIPLNELIMYSEDAYPLGNFEDAYPLGNFEDEFVKLMVKNKTDIFTDGTYYYTRTNYGMTRVMHPKFIMYRDNTGGFKNLIDGKLQ